MYLKPHAGCAEVHNWLEKLSAFVDNGSRKDRVERQWPGVAWRDAETLFSGWLHNLPNDFGHLDAAFCSLARVENLQELCKRIPSGWMDYMTNFLGRLADVPLKTPDPRKRREELAKRIYDYIVKEVGTAVDAKIFMHMLSMSKWNTTWRDTLYRDALKANVADEALFNFYLSLYVNGDFAMALAIVEGSLDFDKPPIVPNYTDEVQMPPSTAKNLLRICWHTKGDRKRELNSFVDLLLAGRVQTEGIDEKEKGALSWLFEDLFRELRKSAVKRPELPKRRETLFPHPSTKALIEEARYLENLDQISAAKTQMEAAKTRLLDLGFEDPDVISAVDVFCALELGSPEFALFRPPNHRPDAVLLNRLWDLVKTFFPAPTWVPGAKLNPGHWDWAAVRLPKRKYVDFGALWILVVVKQMGDLPTELRSLDKVEIVTGGGSRNATGQDTHSCQSVLPVFFRNLGQNVRWPPARTFSGGINTGAFDVTGLYSAFYGRGDGVCDLELVQRAAYPPTSGNATVTAQKATFRPPREQQKPRQGRSQREWSQQGRASSEPQDKERTQRSWRK